MTSKMELVLAEFHFAYLDYLISIAMFHVVQLRRALPKKERGEFDHLVGKLSLMYGQWGEAVLLCSRSILTTESQCLLVD